MTLRVTSGSLRGRRIPLPKHDLRPTSERARQAFFNILGDRIVDARFLDLFAGSGIFSFEAVSRGAASATALEKSRQSVAAIEKLASEWGATVTAIPTDVIAGLRRLTGVAPFDVVYADPPYEYEHYRELLLAIDQHVPLAAEAVVAIEHRRNSEPFADVVPSRLQEVRRAEYGEVWISMFSG